MGAILFLCAALQAPPEKALAELREWLLMASPRPQDAGREPIKSLTPEALRAVRGWIERGYPLLAERRGEVPGLVEALQSDDIAAREEAEARLAAIGGLVHDELRRALAAASTPETRGRLERLVERCDPHLARKFRLRAARVLVIRREKDVIPALIALLRDPEELAGREALTLLRRLTGRRELVAPEAWAAWWEGAREKFAIPRRLPGAGSCLPAGHTLIASTTGVVELDAQDRIVWRHAASGARRAQRLESGNTLMTAGTAVIEVAPDGKTVWQLSVRAHNVFYAHRLEDGTTWIGRTEDNQGVLARYGADHKEVSRVPEIEWPLTFQVLEDGGVLVNQHRSQRVVQVDADGKVVWSWQAPSEMYGILRTEEGTTVVGLSDRVVEVDATGKEVWSCPSPCGQYLYGVKRLRNGNTLLGGYGGSVAEVDRSGKMVWQYAGEGGLKPMDVDRGE